MGKIHVLLLQISSGPDIEANLEAVETLLAGQLIESPSIIVLPESFAYFGDNPEKAGDQSAYIRRWMSKLAGGYKSWLIGGTIPYSEAINEKNRASCFVYDPMGNEVARYDKIHLFDVTVNQQETRYCESDDYQAGSDPQVVRLDTPEHACLGLSVCYDLRFPMLYQRLVSLGANILCVPSAFTYTTGKAHWEVLLRARAIENQCFVLAANQVGVHLNGRKTWGHSMIISPWGEVLQKATCNSSIVSTVIDLEDVEKIRTSMPCINHRRLL